ncbi:class I SAM-dependent methyltransferase [Streptomyces tanashiensis]|uniref:Class I SAM-dependent methyltransferase n=1 Tax=Streptomyces tanashiensis TaxID=67367 RepID=A0ABY6QT84_9ACTN|nr:class I SAM-dependent methyltransferase [Streptomyces tanashiensis]UZX20404.1 class I SAM-dependent methyltransferase [Streptomyces tanashiensis]GGY47333.1 methyltransferase [Streptomyces tanashiensis]
MGTATSPSPRRQAAEFDEIAPVYDESRGGTARAAGFAEQLAPLLDPARPVLDIGVGTGIVAAELTARGHTVHGIDLSPGMLARAKARLGARVAVGDACRLPVRSGSVDQAVSTWLLHAGPDNRAVLAEVARVLRPGGRYLVVPAGGTRPADDIGLLVRELEDRLDPEGSRRDGPEWLAPIAAAHGLVYEGTASERPTSFQVSPRSMAGSLTRGLFTGAWAVGGEAGRLVDETRSRLLALPDPDAPRVRESADVVLVFRREP